MINKYVVFEKGGIQFGVVIPTMINHSDVKIEGCNPVSAGEVSINSEELSVSTFGKSLTLGVKAKEEDGDLIKMGMVGSEYY